MGHCHLRRSDRAAHRGGREVRHLCALPGEHVFGAPQPHRRASARSASAITPGRRSRAGTTSPRSASATAAAGIRWSARSRCPPRRSRRQGRSRARSPKSSRREPLGPSSPLVVGHRGGRGDGWPTENSLDAFEQAHAQGARAIELDVRTCAGGDVVVFHDETLERMTAGRDARRVKDVSRDGLRAVELLGGGKVPALAEVLSWARARGVAVNVEMKHDVPHRPQLARATVGAVRASGADVLSRPSTRSCSRWPPRLTSHCHARSSPIETQGSGAAVLHRDRRDRPSCGRFTSSAPRPPRPRWPATAAAVCASGVWTVNDPEEARELVRLGVASIITDQPGRSRCPRRSVARFPIVI